MNGSRGYAAEQNRQAQLASQFNDFYLQMTSDSIDQIGSYKILEEIGEGGFGKVYLAYHMILGIKVVLKCGLKDDPNIVREVYYHKQLKNRNIVNLYEVIRTENHIWLALEYCAGGELFYYIYEKKRLGLKECQNLFIQIVLAVKYVHSLNLSHRDLKLENILLVDVKKTIVKLSDFGFVREFNPQSRKLLSTICGTNVYMAPELLRNEKYLGFSIDIWALGVILYTMVYGQMPFDEDDDLKTKYKIIHEEPRYPDTIPPDVIELIKRMLCKDAALRPSLNDILNSKFLIDLHNKYLAKCSKRSDAESVISIHQHYNSNHQPFQTKLEKDLLKRLQKLNINLEQLEFNVYKNEMNPLTGFYELLLTQEFAKKKKRYYKEKKKKYYEAKKSLIRSGKRVKSVLSLSDQSSYSGSYPIEKITSTLSLTSLRNNTLSRHTDSRRSSLHDRRSLLLNQVQVPTESPSIDRRVAGVDVSKDDVESLVAKSLSPTLAESNPSGSPPLQRVVAFGTDSSPVKTSSGQDSVATEKTKRKAKDGRLMNRLQFWKKTKRNEEPVTFNDASSTLRPDLTFSFQQSIESALDSNTRASSENGQALSLPLPETNVIHDVDGGLMNEKAISQKNELQNPTQNAEKRQHLSVRSTRPRPTSMISQISQLSQISNLSHMSTMPSESEFLDESDIMDEDYDYEEGMYESSIYSPQDIAKNPVSIRNASPGRASSTRTPTKKHPGYNRTQSSDVSIMSTSTNNTTTKVKGFTLSQLSSNSSDDSSSSAPLILDNIHHENIDLHKIPRPTSPELASSKHWKNSIFSNTVNTPMPKYAGYDNNTPQVLRSNSPPVKPLRSIFHLKRSEDKKSKLSGAAHETTTKYQPVITEEDELTP